MQVFNETDNYILYLGNVLDILDVLEPNSIDSIVTDPPYGLTSASQRIDNNEGVARLNRGFMGQEWDGSGIEYNIKAWSKLYTVLKPGGYLLAFGGSRTFYRIACAIEDAGFEIRDTLMWLYGSGFPKSMSISKGLEAREKLGNACTRNKRKIEQACDTEEFTIKQTNNGAMGELIETIRKEYIPSTALAKQWFGWGTCLKPSFEPIIMARKPFSGNIVENVLEYGVGGINIDECRIGNEKFSGGTMPDFRDVGKQQKEISGLDKLTFGQVENAKRIPCEEVHIGRFPSNVILTYDNADYQEVCNGFPNTKGGGEVKIKGTYGYCFSDKPRDSKPMADGYNDEGSASRYFYCAKASKKDRDEGLEDFEEQQMYNCDNSWNSLEIFGTTDGGRLPRKNIHPTVKPTLLMQYLIRLVTPHGGIILDPFNGSGSTGKAAMYENKERDKQYKYIGIDLNEEYLNISKARIDYAINNDICDKSGINYNGISNPKVHIKKQRKLF